MYINTSVMQNFGFEDLAQSDICHICRVFTWVGYLEASVPLSVRIDHESSKQAFIGCCSSFDIIARTEYSLKLFVSISVF